MCGEEKADEMTVGLAQLDGENHTFGCLSNQGKLIKHFIKPEAAHFPISSVTLIVVVGYG